MYFCGGNRFPFSEEDIRRHLGIHVEHPPPGEDDMFKATVVVEKKGELDMDMVFQVIGRQRTNWANNPTENTIPKKKIDNAILNDVATTWHKLIMVNIDPKIHGTTFDLDHALLIYVLMTEGVVNLPQIMRDVLKKGLTGNSRNLLPYPAFISSLATQHQVPEFPRDEIYKAPPAPQEEKPPPSPTPQPVASEIPSSSVRLLPEPSLREVMRYLRRQEHLQLNT
ncbi:hypothetical protein PIB30_087843 [Stylosanthes scabra]|uniref:Putative plant transposon protein domain-containing protein n=1 Tax=Stylosanthes scabra TaxID=79078 RepID=A0ABU6XSV4_9FABA|nr:hypothetical protein [Stylosanthes scabra]